MIASRSLGLAERKVVHIGIHTIGPAVDRRSVAFGVASEFRSLEVASLRRASRAGGTQDSEAFRIRHRVAA